MGQQIRGTFQREINRRLGCCNDAFHRLGAAT